MRMFGWETKGEGGRWKETEEEGGRRRGAEGRETRETDERSRRSGLPKRSVSSATRRAAQAALLCLSHLKVVDDPVRVGDPHVPDARTAARQPGQWRPRDGAGVAVPAKVGLAQPALEVELRGSRGVGVVAVVRDLLEGVGAHLGEREGRAAAGLRRAAARVFHPGCRAGSLRGVWLRRR